MSRAFLKPFYALFIIILILTFLITTFFTPYILKKQELPKEFVTQIDISKAGFAWPAPGYTTITSYFGKRVSPTAGASSFHKGIDIGAPQGANLVAIIDGEITFVGFLGGGGCTITLSSNNIKITYYHVSPNYKVKVGEFVKQGQIIAQVGPKYLEGIPRKPVQRSSRKTYQWSFNRPTSPFRNSRTGRICKSTRILSENILTYKQKFDILT